MKRETLYASLAGCASFFLIAYGSYLYFSPSDRTGNPSPENAPVPAGTVVEIPASSKLPAPQPEKPSGTDNAAPVAAPALPPTPTAYGAASVAGPPPVEMKAQDDEDRVNVYSSKKKSARMRQDRKADPNARRNRRRAEED
ncbi:MAG TPA: hypothetical protein VH866_10290 [Candidatus Deferrimicrobiaceae bacterium]